MTIRTVLERIASSLEAIAAHHVAQEEQRVRSETNRKAHERWWALLSTDKRFPDLQARITNNPNQFAVSTDVCEALWACKDPVAVANVIFQPSNKDMFAKLAQLDKEQLASEIAKLERRAQISAVE